MFQLPEERAVLDTDFRADQILGGRYRIVSMLGRGGMGVVYEVEQIFVGKTFALKTINKEFISDSSVRRFQHEARASFALSHPNIISVNDFGLLDDGTPFLVMEKLKGETLQSVLEKRGSVSMPDMISIFGQVCLGLAHAHANNVVHRDIKPSNIVLVQGAKFGSEGSVKILDFGIAKFAHNESGDSQALTKTGEIIGSPLYMSPEQCLGASIDHRSDIYSLGCVMFEALTGTTPFIGENALSTMMKHRTARIPSLQEASLGEVFPPALEGIVQKLLAKNPSERYQNLGVAAHDLASISSGGKLAPHYGGSVNPDGHNIKRKAFLTVQRTSFYLILFSVALFSSLTTVTVLSMLRRTAIENVSQKTTDTKTFSKDVLFDSKLAFEKELFKRQNEKEKILNTPALFDESFSRIPKTQDTFAARGIGVSGAALKVIASMPGIKNVVLNGCKISNVGLDALSKLSLKRISLIRTNFDDSGAMHLAKCSSLRSVKINDTAITDVGLQYLLALKNLGDLKIDNTKVTTDGVRSFCRRTSAKQLWLANCKGISKSDEKKLVYDFPSIKFFFQDEEVQ